MNSALNKYVACFSISAFLIAGIILALIADGTAGAGDSPMHFQFARYAPFHPELFFYHWAKPFFVLVSCPSAQFGMTGMKLFNLFLSACAMFMAWRLAANLKIDNAGLIPLFMAFAPAFIHHSLSGLTEPLFGFVTILGALLYLRQYRILALLLFSFLPFVRSEGLIVCGVVAILLLFEKRFLLLPLLLVGHVVYGVAGLDYHRHSVLWVITKIPYARLSSSYGTGTWGHFFTNLPEIAGVPLTILLVAGMLYLLLWFRSYLAITEKRQELLLVYGICTAYFIAHVIFWALGIFNSMGCMRVLIAVVPVMAVIQLRGFNMLVSYFPVRAWKKLFSIIIVLYVLVFPFTPNPYAWHYNQNFCRNTEQLLIRQTSDYIKSNYSDYKSYNYFFDANFLSVDLNVDYFDEAKCQETTIQARDIIKYKKALLVWDDWYSAVQMEVSLDEIKSDKRFRLVKEFTAKEPSGTVRRTVLFESI